MTEDEVKQFWRVNNDLWPIFKKWLMHDPVKMTDDDIRTMIHEIDVVYREYVDGVAGRYAGYAAQAISATIEILHEPHNEVAEYEQETFKR